MRGSLFPEIVTSIKFVPRRILPNGAISLKIVVRGLDLAIEILSESLRVRFHAALQTLALGVTDCGKPFVLESEEQREQYEYAADRYR
jgi:hypothetical protein